jgi:hypothetical protein
LCGSASVPLVHVALITRNAESACNTVCML